MSRRSSSRRTSSREHDTASHHPQNEPHERLLGFTEHELLTFSLQALTLAMEDRGLTREQIAVVNRRRLFLRNRQHAAYRRDSLQYESSVDAVQPPPNSPAAIVESVSSISNDDDNKNDGNKKKGN